MSIETICSLQGSKYQALQGRSDKRKKKNILERLCWSNKDVGLDGQQHEFHWSQLDTDTAYLSNEVELYLLQGSSVE
jgi:hypothetical protein